MQAFWTQGNKYPNDAWIISLEQGYFPIPARYSSIIKPNSKPENANTNFVLTCIYEEYMYIYKLVHKKYICLYKCKHILAKTHYTHLC